MLENIIVGVIGVSFLALMIWGFYVDRRQAHVDMARNRKEREQDGKRRPERTS